MNANDAPSFSDRTWNAYRQQVINALTEIELDLASGRYSLDAEGLTCEVAEKLQIGIPTQLDFDVLHALVKKVRPIAQEAVRSVREDQNGQFSLLLR
jgi:hypothetical protein